MDNDIKTQSLDKLAVQFEQELIERRGQFFGTSLRACEMQLPELLTEFASKAPVRLSYSGGVITAVWTFAEATTIVLDVYQNGHFDIRKIVGTRYENKERLLTKYPGEAYEKVREFARNLKPLE